MFNYFDKKVTPKMLAESLDSKGNTINELRSANMMPKSYQRKLALAKQKRARQKAAPPAQPAAAAPPAQPAAIPTATRGATQPLPPPPAAAPPQTAPQQTPPKQQNEWLTQWPEDADFHKGTKVTYDAYPGDEFEIMNIRKSANDEGYTYDIKSHTTAREGPVNIKSLTQIDTPTWQTPYGTKAPKGPPKIPKQGRDRTAKGVHAATRKRKGQKEKTRSEEAADKFEKNRGKFKQQLANQREARAKKKRKTTPRTDAEQSKKPKRQISHDDRRNYSPEAIRQRRQAKRKKEASRRQEQRQSENYSRASTLNESERPIYYVAQRGTSKKIATKASSPKEALMEAHQKHRSNNNAWSVWIKEEGLGGRHQKVLDDSDFKRNIKLQLENEGQSPTGPFFC